MKTCLGWLAALFGASALLLSPGAPAQAATEKGDQELSLNADIGSTTVSYSGQSFTESTTNILASYGYFLDKNQQIGGAIDYSVVKPDTGDQTQLIYYEGFYKYHFLLPDKPEFVPFLAGYIGQLQLQAAGQSGSGFTWAVGGGAKFFVNETTSLNAEYDIRTSTITVSGASATISDNRLFLGLSIYFGRK